MSRGWLFMIKSKGAYHCSSCGAVSNKWAGQCADCGEWNTFSEVVVKASKDLGVRFKNYSGDSASSLTPLPTVALDTEGRWSTGLDELDRVLGGGLVFGSVTLMGGDPGIGKSTLLLQTLAELSKQMCVIYVTGEESLQQVRLRAERLGLGDAPIQLLAETHVEQIIQVALSNQPRVMVIDSVQTVFTEVLQSAPGSVGQVRESAAHLVRFAKQSQTALFLVGHVTKEGTLAGPRVLEHMVDTVLYFEGETDSRYRLIRAIKNRFGAANELGIFAMTDKGLKVVNNPSAIFLTGQAQTVSGSVVMATWEGSRPLLLEIQALVDESHLANPRRVTVGLEQNRLALILAVLSRHGGFTSGQRDVFLNVVGGARVMETGIDLPAACTIVSSMKNRPLPSDLVVFGELGLSGEVRPVQSGQERIKEAIKLGFKQAIVPKANVPKSLPVDFKITGVQHLQEALSALF